MPSILYRPDQGDPIDLTLGRRVEVAREPGDIALARIATIGLPITLCCLVRASGAVVEWYAEWTHPRADNTYWHFAHGSDRDAFGWQPIPGDPAYAIAARPPTIGQTEAIAQMLFGRLRPFGLHGVPGQPVQQWALAGMSRKDVERLGNAGQPGVYA